MVVSGHSLPVTATSKVVSQSTKHDQSAKGPHENLLQFDIVPTGSAKTYNAQVAKNTCSGICGICTETMGR